MNKNAFADIFSSTLIGSLIGWGGFTQLFPNLLETLGDLTELGSYRGLKVFSIVFFLSILIIVVVYWWARGMEVYYEKVSGHKPLFFKYKNSINAAFVFFRLLPVGLFIADPFYIYAKSGPFPFNHFGSFDWIIWYYLILAVAQLILVSIIIDKTNGIKLLKANTLIFSIDVIMGIGLICFIEPWTFYKGSFSQEITSVCFIYSLVSFLIYILLRNDNNSSIQHYKQYGFALLAIVFASYIFPSVNYNVEWGYGFLGVIFIVLVVYVIITIQLRKKKLKEYKSLLIGLTTVWLSMIILLFAYETILEKANQRYFEDRLKASKKISGNKIFPIILYDNKISNFVGITLNISDPLKENSPLRDSIALYIAKNNHKWSYKKKISQEWIDTLTINNNQVIVNWDSLVKNSNVREIYFSEYFDKKKSDKLTDQKSINDYYNKVFGYIDSTILMKYINPYLGNIQSHRHEKLDDYLHPVNYFAETLLHYKSQTDTLDEIRNLSKDIWIIDTLHSYTHNGQNAHNTDLDIGVINVRKGVIKKIDRLLCSINELQGMTYEGLKEDHKDNIDLFLDLVADYKNKQYQERYKKAQIIFHVYLKDSQRTGVYVLIYTLLIACILYWYYSSDKIASNNNEDGKNIFDTPDKFIKILILSLSIILIYIARPIKAENINPEKPHWMMNLENWYKPTVFETAFKEEKGSNTTTIKIDAKDLLPALHKIEDIDEKLKISAKHLQNIEDHLHENKDFGHDFKGKHD